MSSPEPTISIPSFFEKVVSQLIVTPYVFSVKTVFRPQPLSLSFISEDLSDLFVHLTRRESLQRSNGLLDFGLLLRQDDVELVFQHIAELFRLPAAENVRRDVLCFFLRFFDRWVKGTVQLLNGF